MDVSFKYNISHLQWYSLNAVYFSKRRLSFSYHAATSEQNDKQIQLPGEGTGSIDCVGVLALCLQEGEFFKPYYSTILNSTHGQKQLNVPRITH